MICTAASYPFYVLVMWLTIKPYFKNAMRLTILIVGGAICLSLGLIFARTPMAIICRLELYSSITFCVVIYPMMSEYVGLVSRHVTKKEQVARQRAKKECGLLEDPMKDNITIS